MFFAKKPNLVLFVERDAISLHPAGNTERMPLPDEVFKYLEVRDAKKLSAMLDGFVAAAKSKRVIVVLHKDVLFQKAVELGHEADKAALLTDFEHNIPFDPKDRHAVGLAQKDHLYMFGANKQFYQLIVDACERADVKVAGVVPGLVYGVTAPTKLTHTKLEQIFDATGLTQAVNFISQKN